MLTRRLRTIAVLLAAVGCVAAAAIVFRGGEPGGRVGVSTHLGFAREQPRPQLRRIHAGGVGWIREDFPWDAIEPEPGRWDWSATDALMAAAAQEDVRVLAVLAYSARWASSDPGGEGNIYFPPRDSGAYADFAAGVADRYGPDGRFWRANPELPERPLAAIELWNEPWGRFFWKPEPDPARYAALASRAIRAVREVAPDIDLLVSADLLQVRGDGAARPWLDALLDAAPELADAADGFTVHPYPSPRDAGPDDTPNDPRYGFGRVRRVHEILRTRGADRPIWITEIGWTTATGVDDAVSEERQAAYVARALDRSLDEWDDFVERVFVYSWDRSSGMPGDREGNYGLRRADDTVKPAWNEITARAG